MRDVFLNKHKWWLKIALIWALFIMQNIAIYLLYRTMDFGNDFANTILFILLIIIISTLYLKFFFNKRGKEEFIINFSESKIIVLFLLMTFVSIYLIDSFIHFKEILNHQFFAINWNFNWNSNWIIEKRRLYQSIKYLFFALLCAPVTEEIVFRGLIQNSLLQKTSPFWAILITAGIFSLSHFELSRIPYTFIGGLLYGIIYYRTRKVIISILCHFCWSFIAIFTVFTPNEANTKSILILVVALLTAAFFPIFLLKNKISR